MLKAKFRGCLVGALLGDCFGSPYQLKCFGLLPSQSKQLAATPAQIQTFFDDLEGAPDRTAPRQHTGDTTLTKYVAESLIQHNSFNARDMAEKLNKEYSEDTPATEQYNWKGPYSNDGAMRISPVALFAHNNYENMIEIAEKCAKLTHTDPLGVNGAILQAIAIFLVLKRDPEIPLDIGDYMKELIAKNAEVESRISCVVSCYSRQLGWVFEDRSMAYSSQLEKVQRLLEMKDQVTSDQVVEQLGNHVLAIVSNVPIAIYCFLRAQNPIPMIVTDNPFRRTIQYAISLGGDTDTIASMAGAIAGGYYGIDMIPENLQKLAEGQLMIDSLATKLYEKVSN